MTILTRANLKSESEIVAKKKDKLHKIEAKYSTAEGATEGERLEAQKIATELAERSGLPKQDAQAWWAMNKGKKGEPLPLTQNEIAVVNYEWLAQDQNRVTLSNGWTKIVPTRTTIGWDANLEDGVVFLLTFRGETKQYRNAIPKKLRDVWEKKNRFALRNVKRNVKADNADAPVSDATPAVNPITKKESTLPSKQEKKPKQEEQVMKFKKESVVALFVALDYNTAPKWNEKRLLDKIATLAKMVDQDTEVADPELAKLLKKLLKATAAGEEIILIGGDAKADPSYDWAPSTTTTTTTPEPLAGKKAKKKDELVPVGKKKAASKPAGKKGPGICACIIEEFSKGTASKPISVDKVLEVLVKKFPDKDPKGMRSTISGAFSWMRTEKGLNPQRNEKGIWLEK